MRDYNTKHKVLHLITALNYGGAEKVVFDLASNANNDKFDVRVACLAAGDMIPKFEKNNIAVFVCNQNKSISGLISAIRKLYKHIKSKKIEIIHAHMYHALLVASIIKLFRPKTKIVFTPHNVNLEHISREIITFLLRPLRLIDILFSKIEKKRFYNGPVCVIPNGIKINQSVNRKAKRKDEEFVFICVGGFRPQKNYLQFFERVVSTIDPKFKFKVLIAGKGELVKEIEQSIKQNGIENRVQLLGLRNDIPELLDSSDAFLMPSKWEGFPIAILEAGERQMPIIATPVGSVPNILNEECGYVSSINDFASTMEFVMENHEKALLRGKNLRGKIIEKYSIQSVIKQHESLYSELLN